MASLKARHFGLIKVGMAYLRMRVDKKGFHCLISLLIVTRPLFKKRPTP
jgi:hypothetical protein